MTSEHVEKHKGDGDSDEVQTHASCCDADARPKTAMHTDNTSAHGSNLTKIVIFVFCIAAAANIFFLGTFAYSVNKKVNEAVDLAKPQTVSLVLVSPDNCTFCQNLTSQKDYILKQNVEVGNDKTVSMNSAEGKQLIEQYHIENLPAIVLLSDDDIKSSLAQAFEKGSHKEGNNAFVWESLLPPFVDAATGNIEGLVHVTYLTDKSCSTCYDVQAVQTPILQQFGLVPASATRVDIADKEGQELLKMYAITKVPTVLLSPEADAYTALSQVWGQVGTIEKDGTYVFRDTAVLQATYKDLTTNKIVQPSTNSAS